MSPPPCIVGFCKNRGTHLLPSDETRRAHWIQAIEHLKPGLTVRKHSRICSGHFKPTDFNRTQLFLLQSDAVPKTLKKTAVPSVFQWDKASQECKSTSQDQDLLVFDITKVKETYTRTPQIQFVEEQPYLNTVASDFTGDPLNLGVEDQTDLDASAANDDTRETIVMKMEVDIGEELKTPLQEQLMFQERLLSTTEKLEISVQTVDVSVLGFQTLKLEKSVQTEDVSVLCFQTLKLEKSVQTEDVSVLGFQTLKLEKSVQIEDVSVLDYQTLKLEKSVQTQDECF